VTHLQLAIFDCDGVFVDSEAISNTIRAGMRAIGFAGDGDEDALRTAGAQCIRAMAELPQLLRLE
jgi:beta-phosphoglucomutase-like phosphatase (HAD superfamily)